ncbi:hypothetical protein [Streptomyces sp. NPDC051079]|uniref:hypothetical protein n=1 Tax=Streptomyces sp. NPDC051079 TaxID=3155043 RepID=UPI00344C7BCF
MHRRDLSDLGAHWLADGHPDPDRVWEEWNDEHGVALLPAGVRWDAVSMPQGRMQAVVEDMGPLAVDRCPILADLGSARAYVFVQPGTAAWTGAFAEDSVNVISEGSWLVASRPLGRQSRAGTWLVAPSATLRLASPEDLLASLRRTAGNEALPEAAACGMPCPDPAHHHACARSSFHCGIHRDTKRQGAETCSWTRRETLG